jgi:hypothetical protein
VKSNALEYLTIQQEFLNFQMQTWKLLQEVAQPAAAAAQVKEQGRTAQNV